MQKDSPLISIIVPVYNVQKYLEECIESLETQTITDREIIMVDDGSTDNSGELCDQLAEKYSDIRVVHKENGGLASARNAGLDVATGMYVGFVDSDDYVAPDMYEKLYKAIQNSGYDIACCNWYRCIDNNGEYLIQEPEHTQIKEMRTLSSEDTIRSLLLNQGITYSACDKLFKRKLFENTRFPDSNLPSEDIPCIYSVLARSKGVAHIGEAVYYYRVTPGSISQSVFRPKNMSTFVYMQDVYKDICDTQATLVREAEYALIQSAASIYARICNTDIDKKCIREKRQIEAFFRKKSNTILKNIYLSRNAKIAYIAIGIKLYPILMKIRS